MTHNPPDGELPPVVYTPTAVSKLTVSQISYLEATRAQAYEIMGGESGIFRPARPGNVVVVLGLSANWKTGFIVSELRREAARLDPAGDEACLYITWEDSVEETGILDVANETRLDVGDIVSGNVKDWDAIKRAAVRRGTLPLYVIGHSLANRKARARITMTDVAKAVYAIEDRLGIRFKLVGLDYLQIIPPDIARERQDKRIIVDENAQRIKDMSLALGCVTLMGCQAKQDLMERSWKLPRMNDGMETSGIMHVGNIIVGLWRPQTTDPNQVIGDPPFKVHPDMLIVGNAKQRRGETGDVAIMNVDFATNTLRGKMDMTTINLNED